MLLNCHTYYSFKFGTLEIEQLLDQAKLHNHDCIALTDINTTAACLSFVREALKRDVKPVLGIDFRNGAKQQYVGIARNNEGYRELNEHLTYYSHNGIPFPDRAPSFQHAYVIYQRGAIAVKDLRENEFIGVSTKTITRLIFANKQEEQHKWVFLQPVTFLNKNEKGERIKNYFNAHRLLRAIDNNTLLSMLSPEEQGDEGDVFRTPDELRGIFEQYPTILINTMRILDDCSIHFEFGKSNNKKFLYGLSEDEEIIRRECAIGLKYRYGDNPASNVLERLETELGVIRQQGFNPYFLINWDMVNYARNNGYFYVGRGSGANSLVAYLMRITDVDPIELDLYFERFINIHRSNPPDFDIDFSWTDREDVTRYLFDKYSWKNTALVGAYSTFQSRSVIRELGKVFGLPAHEIDMLQEAKNLSQVDQLGQTILRYSRLIHDFPSHLTVHSSGIVISEEPISCYTATMLPPKGFPTLHLDMHDSENIGLHKFDVLAQRGLAKIKDTVELVKQNRNIEVDIHDIVKFKNDAGVQHLLRSGKAIGCFYVESPAMRMLLTKLKAHDYVRLVAASSIIRPGVAKSGMMREYILRFQDEERRKKAREELPELYDILHDTYGVMVYQEDVLRVGHIFGGLTLAEADILRRGMNWKFMKREEFRSVRQQFFDNCIKKGGHKPEVVNAIWTQIESFANFAFAKGHSASYAVESFQALYLKAYYPLEYMVATINNGGGFYSVELYVHELRMHGAIVEAPCVNRSESINTIQGDVVHLGLGMISQLEEQNIALIVKDRAVNGPFRNLFDFIQRLPVSLEQLLLLIRIGAFRFSGTSIKELLWEAHLALNKHKKRDTNPTLFKPEFRKVNIPALNVHPLEDAYAQMELLGFPLQAPESMLKDPVETKLLAGHLPFKVGQKVTIVGYLIHRKRTSTSGGQQMYFGTWLDLLGDWIDTVHFPQAAQDYPFTGPGCYNITGVVTSEFDFVCIEVESIIRLPYQSLDDLYMNDKEYRVSDSKRVESGRKVVERGAGRIHLLT